MLLAHHFPNKMGSLNPKGARFLSGAIHQMMKYHWPGNVRELKNRLERALVPVRGVSHRSSGSGLALLPKAEGAFAH